MPFWATLEKWSKLTGYSLWGPKWRFCEVRTSAVRCPFELKITWGLCLALKSSQNNFQLKRTSHGGGGASAKTPFWPSKGTTCEFCPKPKHPEKGVFGHFGIYPLFKIDFSAHFGPETLLRSQIGALFEKVIFEVLGFGVPQTGSQPGFCQKNFQNWVRKNFLSKICFLGQFLTLNRISRSKVTFEQ